MTPEWTKEKRDRIVTTLRFQASCAESDRYELLADDLREAADALEAMGEVPKSAEASMKERIEGLETYFYQIRAIAGLAGTNAFAAIKACSDIVGLVDDALHGPSDPDRDPDRDRETQAEQVKP